MNILRSFVSALSVLMILAPSVILADAVRDFNKATEAYQLGKFPEALKWYRKAADQGSADAQSNLGFMYRNGEGVIRDGAKAVKWYRKAANQGDAEAQSNLGLMYALGEGVIKDNILAHMWWNISASKGVKEARGNRGIVEKKMTSAEITWARQKAKLCLESNYKGCD